MEVTTRIVVFSDGSHATKEEQSSQLGYLILITENTHWHLLECKSYKSRRVVSSPLAAETMNLADASESAIYYSMNYIRYKGRSYASHY